MNLFGTDGIRGKFGQELTQNLAYALGKVLAEEQKDGIVVVGKDTRVSGETLLSALSKGVHDHGGQVLNLGIVPTNAVAHCVLRTGADFGVMISASHNPPEYNGLKVFDKYGVKICLSKQKEFSKKILETEIILPSIQEFLPVFEGTEKNYVNYLKEKFPIDCNGLSIALDCCYGSAYKLAKKAFANVNAKITAYCDFAKGQLINVDCGATQPDFLAEQMDGNGCVLGFAFDGDADRLAVFEGREYLLPDRLLYAFAKYFKESNKLTKDTVVGTVMTDGGLEKSLKEIGVHLVRTQVGDSNIFEEMMTKGYVLGGENSGHYLLSNYATGSDALINALLTTEIYLKHGSILQYTSEYKPFCRLEKSLLLSPSVLQRMKENCVLQDIQNNLSQNYPSVKTVARFSGTEPKIRLMTESSDQAKVTEAMTYLLDLIEKNIHQ